MMNFFGKSKADPSKEAPKEQQGQMNFFGQPKPDPKEQVKEWKKTMRAEMRKIDRQIVKIDREVDKMKLEIKRAAKQGEMAGAKILAKQLVRTRTAKERMLITKANMNSVEMQLTNQVAYMKVAGAMQQSTEIMKSMNTLIKDKECFQVMKELAQEMQHANLIGELMDEAFEDMDDESLEDESNEAIDQILAEIIGKDLAGLSDAPKQPVKRVPAGKASEPEEASAVAEDGDDDAEMQEMKAKLAALRAL